MTRTTSAATTRPRTANQSTPRGLRRGVAALVGWPLAGQIDWAQPDPRGVFHGHLAQAGASVCFRYRHGADAGSAGQLGIRVECPTPGCPGPAWARLTCVADVLGVLDGRAARIDCVTCSPAGTGRASSQGTATCLRGPALPQQASAPGGGRREDHRSTQAPHGARRLRRRSI